MVEKPILEDQNICFSFNPKRRIHPATRTNKLPHSSDGFSLFFPWSPKRVTPRPSILALFILNFPRIFLRYQQSSLAVHPRNHLLRTIILLPFVLASSSGKERDDCKSSSLSKEEAHPFVKNSIFQRVSISQTLPPPTLAPLHAYFIKMCIFYASMALEDFPATLCSDGCCCKDVVANKERTLQRKKRMRLSLPAKSGSARKKSLITVEKMEPKWIHARL